MENSDNKAEVMVMIIPFIILFITFTIMGSDNKRHGSGYKKALPTTKWR